MCTWGGRERRTRTTATIVPAETTEKGDGSLSSTGRSASSSISRPRLPLLGPQGRILCSKSLPSWSPLSMLSLESDPCTFRSSRREIWHSVPCSEPVVPSESIPSYPPVRRHHRTTNTTTTTTIRPKISMMNRDRWNPSFDYCRPPHDFDGQRSGWPILDQSPFPRASMICFSFDSSSLKLLCSLMSWGKLILVVFRCRGKVAHHFPLWQLSKMSVHPNQTKD
jgi:hypothetical protein